MDKTRNAGELVTADADNAAYQASLKYQASDVEGENWPKSLRDLGNKIAAHLERAHKSEQKAEQHRVSAGQLLEQVMRLCDADAFNLFQKKFCPDLGRSRAYELKTIATGKNSPEEVRAATRKRVAKHRRVKSVTGHVTDSLAITSNGNSTETAEDSAEKRKAQYAEAEPLTPTDADDQLVAQTGDNEHRDAHDDRDGGDHRDDVGAMIEAAIADLGGWTAGTLSAEQQLKWDAAVAAVRAALQELHAFVKTAPGDLSIPDFLRREQSTSASA
jgi:hypothetical protein